VLTISLNKTWWVISYVSILGNQKRNVDFTEIDFSSRTDFIIVRLSVTNNGLQSNNLSLSLSLTLRPTVSRPVCLGVKHPFGAYDQIFIIVWQLRFFWFGPPLRREDGSVVYNCRWPSPGQPFSGPSPVGLVAIFYCLRFETSLFVASYDSQGQDGGIRPRLHTGFSQSNNRFLQ
jgi:hypothetical protein